MSYPVAAVRPHGSAKLGPLPFTDPFDADLSGWTGATWLVAAGALTNAPVAGSELVANGGFDSDTVWGKGAGWSIAGGVGVAGAATNSSINQTILTVGQWYQGQFDLVWVNGNFYLQYGDNNQNMGPYAATANNLISTGRAVSFTAGGVKANTAQGSVDNVSFKPLTRASLFRTRIGGNNVTATTRITRTVGTQAGIVLNLDSAVTPANFIIAYLDGVGNAKLEKCVGGTFSSVITGAVTYSANAVLSVTKSGTAVSLTYNGISVGSGTVSDAGIISNTLIGLFSTYSANSFSEFTAVAA